MKILTVTFHRSRNYGAVLQAYALQTALKKCGYETAIVDYCRTFKNKKSLKQKLRECVIDFLNFLHRKERRILNSRFDAFINDHIALTDKYETYEELEKNPPETDMYLLGSDQVWNIYHRPRPEFFAEFAPKTARVASYAASVGRYDYPPHILELFGRSISKVSPVSVREADAKAFIEKNFDKKASVHPDPVFLLSKEDWSGLAADAPIKEKYILCFSLARSELLKEAAYKLKRETGYKLVSITPSAVNFVRGDKNIYNAGPREFLSYIKNAEIVLTNSFHGTAFSIIFERDFYNFTTGPSSTRTVNLLETLGLSGRAPKSLADVNTAKIDYSNVSGTRQELVDDAYQYLNSLKESL